MPIEQKTSGGSMSFSQFFQKVRILFYLQEMALEGWIFKEEVE